MSQPGAANPRVRTAAEVCEQVALSSIARGLLGDTMTPRQYLDRLREHGLFADAAKLVAHALPKRQAVWWACLGVGKALAEQMPEAAAAALEAARAWVADPTEEKRRAAKDAAEAAGFDTPAGCVALAVFFSGGSLAPSGLPAVPPADKLTGEMVAAAVSLAVVREEPEKAPAKYADLLQMAIDVADGKNLWPAVKQPAGRK